jgi:hypothetical protein
LFIFLRVWTYCYTFLMLYISNVYEMSYNMTRNLGIIYCLTKQLSNPNYIPVNMKVKYLFNMCLLKVGRMFCKLVIPKICVSSLFSPVMKCFMFDLPPVTDKLHHIMLYRVWSGFELTTLVVICTDLQRKIPLPYDHDHDGPLSLCIIRSQR